MQPLSTADVDLFVALAEIAGVFVGFGALIGFVRTGEVEAQDRLRINGVVFVGLLVLVAALTPVGLAGYPLTPDTVWRISSLAFLALIWGGLAVQYRDPADRALVLATLRKEPVGVILALCLEPVVQIPLVLILLGTFPALSSALYTTALLVNLLQVSLLLLELVSSKPTAAR